MEETNKKRYKIEVGDVIQVVRSEWNDKVYYKTPIKKIDAYGREILYEKILRFKGNPDIPNGTYIKMMDFMEDMYYRKSDRYNPVWYLVVLEWIEVEPKEDAIKNFNKTIDENDLTYDAQYDIDVPF